MREAVGSDLSRVGERLLGRTVRERANAPRVPEPSVLVGEVAAGVHDHDPKPGCRSSVPAMISRSIAIVVSNRFPIAFCSWKPG